MGGSVLFLFFKFLINFIFKSSSRFASKLSESTQISHMPLPPYMHSLLKHEVIDVDFSSKKLKVKNLITDEILEESYDKLMIASGARAIIPPIKNIDLENVVTLKSMDDGNKLRELMASDEYKKVAII